MNHQDKCEYYGKDRGFSDVDKEIIPIYLAILRSKIRDILRKSPYIPKKDLIFMVLWTSKKVETEERYLSQKGYTHVKDRLEEYIKIKRKNYL